MSKHLQLHQFRRTPHPRFRRFTSNHQPKFPPLRLQYLLPSWKQGRFHLRSNHVTPHVLYLQYTIIRICIQSPHPMHFASQSHKVPQPGIQSISSKLVFKRFDEYANILKDMYSTRFNGNPEDNRTHDQMDTVPRGTIHPSSPLSKCDNLITLDTKGRRRRRGLVNIKHITCIQLHIYKETTIRSPLNPTLTYRGTDRTYQRDRKVGCIT
jgi:hypothetical protein